MLNSEVRRRNFWYLVHPHGYREDDVRLCAEKTGLSETRIRALIKKTPDIPGRNIGNNAARDIEEFYDLPEGWLDQPHPDLWGGEVSEIESYEVNVEVQDKGFHIESYDEVAGSMGGGVILHDQPGQITSINVNNEWANKNIPAHTGMSNIKIITGFGDSMQPMFMPGDPLLIDIGVKDCNHDGVYFFRIGNDGFVKRLQRIPGQGIRVISSNPSYESWTITEDMDFEILGKVLRTWAHTNT